MLYCLYSSLQYPLSPPIVYGQANRTCESNPYCNNFGLKGNCCPDENGKYNSCAYTETGLRLWTPAALQVLAACMPAAVYAINMLISNI